MTTVPLALYVHIPFCAYRCRYCNFTFETGWSPAVLQKTLDTLVAEARALRAQGEGDGLAWSITTLYLGGGTPGLVPPDQLEGLLRGLEDALGFRAAALEEVTLEANPENVTSDALAAWAAAGVNRLSLGVQTFHDGRLALLGRRCDAATSRRALGLIAALWPGRWSADLMTGLPGQGDLPPQPWTELRRDVDEVLAYGPGHLSLYSLIVEPGTELERLVDGRALRVASDPMADQLWLSARGRLLDAGFDWYEISNFARPGQRSRHNQTYWSLDPWAGLGPGAEGTLPARDPEGGLRPLRTRNPKLFPWLSGERHRETLSAADFALEHYLAGWRSADGVAPGRLQGLFGAERSWAPARLSDTERLTLDRLLQALPDFHGLSFRRDWP